MIRSSGGWSGIVDAQKSGVRLKGDERILGDSDYVLEVLGEAEEQFERRYALKSDGYNFEKVSERIEHYCGSGT